MHLLDGWSLRLDHLTLTGLDQPRFQRLLAFLALHRRTPVSRQQLAFLFWPDTSNTQARTNLRNLLYRLQQEWPQMGQWIDARGAEIHWQADAAFDLDVEQFEQALAAAAASADGVEVEAHLRQALEFYAGDLLPNLYDDWVLQERERLRAHFIQALEQLVQILEDNRRYADAIVCCQRLLRQEPLQERVYRHLMRFYALADDRAAALRVYHTCATTLERDLGVEPSPQTREAYERILQLDNSPRIERHAAHSLPLVGRHAEWRQLLAAWQRSGQGQRHLLLIQGEAGMGKTRLAEELAVRVRRQGYAVADARAYAAEGGLAYAPVADWLRSPSLQSGLPRVDDIWLVEAARLLPEILQRHPHLPHPGPMREGWQRQRFFEGLTRLFAAAPQPLLLLLDDLQWADPETLEWLHFLLRSALPLRLLVVGTVRREDVDREHPLATLTHYLRAAGQLTEIELGPLNPVATAHLADHVAGTTLPREMQEQLFRDSEGNPLFLVETVQAGERGLGASDAPAESVTGPVLPSPVTSLPPKIHAVISARLAQLSAPARQLAGLAAVVGRQCTFAVLAAASDADGDDLVQALDELWRRRIVREQEEDAYDFNHGHIRTVAYSELSRVRQRLLHGRVAATLEALHASDLDEFSARLAAHYEAADDPGKAVSFYGRAGEKALSDYLPRQALLYFQRAETLAQTKPARADALYGLGRAHFHLDQHQAAIHSFQQALALTATADARRGRLLYAVANIYFSALYDLEAAEPAIRQALAAAEAAEEWETVCQSLSLLGQYHSSRWGNLSEEARFIRRALAIARRTHNGWREGRTLADLAFLQGQQSDFGTAEESARQALDLLAKTDDKAGVAFAWNVLGRALGGRGAYSTAFDAFRQSEEMARSIEQRSLLAQIPNMRGWLHQQLWDYAGALVLDQEGMALAQEWGKFTAEISARINLCLDMLHLGNPAQALADLERLEPSLGEKQYGYHAWRWRLRLLHAQGLCHLALGRRAEALAAAEVGIPLAQSVGAQKYVALYHEVAGVALAAVGQPDEGILALKRALALADQIAYQPLRWQGRLRLAQVATRTRQPDLATVLLAEAQEIVHAIADDVRDEELRTIFLAAPPIRSILTGDIESLKL